MTQEIANLGLVLVALVVLTFAVWSWRHRHN